MTWGVWAWVCLILFVIIVLGFLPGAMTRILFLVAAVVIILMTLL